MKRQNRLLTKAAGLVAAAIPALAAMLSLSSCATAPDYYSRFETLRDARWAYGDTLYFVPDATEDSVVSGGTLVLAVRHTRAYPYSNLWLEFRSMRPDSTWRCDTINLRLADDFGRRLGSGIGTDYMVCDTIADGSFTLRRGFPMTVRHIMRADTLGEIEQVGLVFTPKP